MNDHPGVRLRCVLFDADGVLQHTPDGWLEDLRAMGPADPDGFLAAVLAAEEPSTRGETTFREALAPVFARYRVDVPIEDVFEVWDRLVVDPEMMTAIAELRRAGVICALATNQHDVRAQLMRAMPDYRDAFDAHFYSSELGVAKPSPAYFTAIVQSLGVEPAETLFVDDREDNVEGARAAGLWAEVFTDGGGRPELDRILAHYRVGTTAG